MAIRSRCRFSFAHACLLLVLATYCSGCNRATEEAPYLVGMRVLEEGQTQDGHVDAEQLRKAVGLFDEALAETPDNAAAIFYRTLAKEKLSHLDPPVTDVQKQQIDELIDGYTNAIDKDDQIRDRPDLEANPANAPLSFMRAEAFYQRGLLHTKLGERDRAIQDLTAAIAIDNDFGKAYCARGNLMLNEFPEIAEDDFSDAIRTDARNQQAHAQRAKARVALHDYTNAIVDCRNAIRLKPECAACFETMGTAYASLSKPENQLAVSAYREAMRLNPELAKEVDHMIAALPATPAPANDVGQPDLFAGGVPRDLDRSGGTTAYRLPLDQAQYRPSLPPAEISKEIKRGLRGADDALNAGRWDEAVKGYEAVIKLDPRVSEALVGRGIAYLKKKNPDAALQDFDEALRLSRKNPAELAPFAPYPDLGYVYYQRALAFQKSGSSILAARDATNAIRVHSQWAEAYLLRAEAYVSHDNFDLVFSDLDEAIRLNPALAGKAQGIRVQAYVGRGAELVGERKIVAAMDDFNHAIALDPKFARAYRERGFAEMENSNWDAAIKDFETAVRLNPGMETQVVRRAMATSRRNRLSSDNSQVAGQAGF